MPDRPDAVLLTWDNPLLREALAGAWLIEGADGSALDEPARHAVRVLVTTGVQKIGPAEMDVLPNLGRIVAIASGSDGIDRAAAEARGIEIRTGSGGNADAVAESAVGLFLAVARHILSNDAYVREGRWRGVGGVAPVRSVGAMKVGIVGMGFIGRAIAARLAPFGCDIAWTGPRAKPDVAHRYVPDLLDLARESDALIVAAPLSVETAGMIGAEVLDALGPEGVLVNVGRGRLLDEDALIAALREGRLAGAALDVFVQEPTPAERWRDVPNVILSPHAAGITRESMTGLARRAAENAVEFLQRAPPRPALG